MRAALAIAALVVVFTIGFLAIGAAHRDRCLHIGMVSCTLIPWSGHWPAQSKHTNPYGLYNGSISSP